MSLVPENMANSPELDGKFLGTITSDFVKVSDLLRNAAYEIRARHISEYPIFPISREPIAIGQLLLEPGQQHNEWAYYFSFLEEFAQRGLVSADKVEIFKATYKDIQEFCCLFVVDSQFLNFVFVPYPVEEDEKPEVNLSERDLYDSPELPL